MNLVCEFIKYKWKAKGRHGIHSPFIYSLVEKGIQGDRFNTNFQCQNSKNLHFERLVFKLVKYFNSSHIFINKKNKLTDWDFFLKINFPSSKIRVNFEKLNPSDKNSPFDFVIISTSSQLQEDILELIPYSKNDTVFLIEGIRGNASSFLAWKKICEMDTFHVSIDFFQSGLLIARSEQDKEHFTLSTY